MEDHHNNHGHHHHHHHQQQQYGDITTDLRQLVNGTRFPSSEEFFPGHRNLTALVTPQQQQQYEMMMLGHRGVVLEDFNTSMNTIVPPPLPPTTTTTTTTSVSVSTPETAGCIGGDASTGRWPRQETLTLLEIRSRLDPKFKEANQKGPLWDEVSRIMCEEHGYQRSGKKCREKFENLYKYYKKTKEGKAGRHDGKHYRFFRQLEALYGENSNTTCLPETNFVNNFNFQKNQEIFHHNNNINNSNNKNICDDHSLSLTNSTDFDTSSCDDDDNDQSNDKRRKRKSGRRSWKVKIKEFIDSQMKKLVEKQEEWLSKLVKTLEEKEKERVLRDEEWRKQEVKRVEREQKFWANERAWIEARDAALMEALKNINGREMLMKVEDHDHDEGVIMESHHEIQNNIEKMNEAESEEGNKKRKEKTRSCFYFDNNEQSSMYNNQGSTYCDVNDQQREESIVKLQRNIDHDGTSPSNSNVGSFPFLISEGGNLWENFGLKINKENQNH